MAGMAQTFADALQRAEESRDPAPLVELFAEDAKLSNFTHGDEGQEGARRFWQTYLDQFDRIRSTFSRLIEMEAEAALVWTSEGALKGGHPITYQGVSVIETDGGKVRRFETYYDSAAFLRHDAPAGKGAGGS